MILRHRFIWGIHSLLHAPVGGNELVFDAFFNVVGQVREEVDARFLLQAVDGAGMLFDFGQGSGVLVSVTIVFMLHPKSYR